MVMVTSHALHGCSMEGCTEEEKVKDTKKIEFFVGIIIFHQVNQAKRYQRLRIKN